VTLASSRNPGTQNPQRFHKELKEFSAVIEKICLKLKYAALPHVNRAPAFKLSIAPPANDASMTVRAIGGLRKSKIADHQFLNQPPAFSV
jgi:hypothetical protein